MFPLVVIGVIGGYWLLYDGWQRVSHFSPTNPLSGVAGAVQNVAGTLVNPGLASNTTSQESADINKFLGPISKYVNAHPNTRADFDTSVKPAVVAFTSNRNDATFTAALEALRNFAKKYGITI